MGSVADASRLQPYFARIGFSGPAQPTLDTLQQLHRRHPAAIPFENIETWLKRDVPIDSPSVYGKLVNARRGGYCFEQNRLFSDALKAIGFGVVELAARVLWLREPEPPMPRTHMVLLVTVHGVRYVADVGFGGLTLTAALELAPGLVQSTPHERFRIVERRDAFELQAQIKGDWLPVYSFDLQPQLAVDYEVANHYVATHPDSWFRYRLVAAKPTDRGRLSLSDRTLTERFSDGTETRRELRDAAELRAMLETGFGIAVPAGPAFEAAAAGLFGYT